jgi:hypothetical protein
VRTLRVTPESSAGLKINDAPNGRLVLLMPAQRNEIDAEAVLQAWRARYPDVFANRQVALHSTGSGEKGINYAAFVQPFDFEATPSARGMCDSLKAAGAVCIIVDKK